MRPAASDGPGTERARRSYSVFVGRPQVLRAADWIVELGPGAGPEGGRVVAEGPPAAVAATGFPEAPWLGLRGRWQPLA